MKRYKINKLVYKCYENDTLVEDPDGEWVRVSEVEKELEKVFKILGKRMEEELAKAVPDYDWTITFEKVIETKKGE